MWISLCANCIVHKLFVHGILQARTLEWVAISFCRGSSWPRDWTQISYIEAYYLPSEPPGKPYKTVVIQSLSRVWLCNPMTVALQAPLSMGFPRKEYWSGELFSFPQDLPDPEIEPRSPTLKADSFYHLSHQGSPIHKLGNILSNGKKVYCWSWRTINR